MALKLKREHLERIVYEELTRFMAEQLTEAPTGAGTVLDDELPNPEDAPEEGKPSTSPAGEDGNDPGEPDELPTGDEPADDELEQDVAGEDESGAEEGTVAAEIEGKTVESISMEEDSKILPGASEVVVTFRDSPDALHLLLTKTGKVKVFYKGLHTDFTSAVEQIPGKEEPEDELGAGEEAGPEFDIGDALGDEEETEDMPPLDDEDLPPEGDKKSKSAPSY
jgi:hypothetical protein